MRLVSATIVLVFIGIGSSLSAQSQNPTAVKITSVSGVGTGAPHDIVLSAGGPANQNYQFLSATNPETLTGRGGAWNIEGFVQADSTGSLSWSKAASAPSEFYKVIPINGTPGQLYMFIDQSANSAYTLSIAGNAVALGGIRLLTVGEAEQATQLGFTLTAGSPNDLVGGEVKVYDTNSGVYLGSAVFTGNNTNASLTLSGNVNELVPANTTAAAALVFKGQLSPLGEGANDGDLVQVNLTSAQGVGVTSGATIQAQGGGSYDQGVRVIKSYPIIGFSNNLASTGVADGKLIEWTVTAQNGDVQTKKFSFGIITNNCSLGYLYLTVYSDANYTQQIPVNGDGWDQSTILPEGNFELYYASDYIPFVVPAGSTYYFRLTATVTPFVGASNYSVSTTLAGDPVGTSGLELEIDRGYYANMIWTDQPGTARGTMLFNGCGIPGLPATGVAQVRTN